VLNPTSRSGAGALAVELRANGTGYGLIQIPAGGSNRPFAADTAIEDTRMVMTDGRAVFTRAVDLMVATSRTALARAGLGPEGIAHLVPHQANQRMIGMMAMKLGIAPERTLSTIAEFGNSSAATIPFTLSVCAPERNYQRGDNLLLTAAGAGLTGGSLVWVW